MLFDLQSGRRKRVVQVVYATLAILMGGSLVLFGIGSDAPGGILDAIGLGDDEGGGDPQFEQEIDDAQARLETDPTNQQALLDLVRYNYLSATESGVSTDPTTGATQISEAARSDLEASVAAWERYLDANPGRPDVTTAANAAQAYQLLLDAGGAAIAQEIVAEDQKTAAAYYQLALYLYVDFQFEAGDAAAEKTIAAAGESERAAVRKNLEQIAETYRKEKQRIDKQAEEGGGQQGAEQELTDPFGALEGAPTGPGATIP